MKKTISLRQRKFLLVLPVLVIPFITMAFWALGGGKETPEAPEPGGLITELPGASLKDDRGLDKLGYYDRAAADSLALLEQMKNDPYFTKTTMADTVLDALAIAPGMESRYTDPNEAKVYARLGQLNSAMKEAGSRENDPAESSPEMEKAGPWVNQKNESPPDNDMEPYNSMLEKILDIQHPERVKEKKQQDAGETFTVRANKAFATFSSLDSSRSDAGEFYGLHDKRESVNGIAAVVHETQTLVSGAIVKMRLLSDIIVNGQTIPKDHFVYGTAALNKERLEIQIPSIRLGNTVFPVKMEVYDIDGLAGIYIPGAIGREVAKQSGDNALQSLQLGSIDPSPGAQAAAAGIETAKTFLSRKVRLVKVQVKAGYKIFLQNKTN